MPEVKSVRAPAEAKEQSKVTLISMDGVRIVVTEEEARVSKALALMLDDNEFKEGRTKEISLCVVRAEMLRMVVDYMKYVNKYSRFKNFELTEAEAFRVDPAKALELMEVADFLKM
ncbi:hypothetical protein QR680_018453 [Steinernema hermaphroditum]|uniref:Elongin-C n=1 Tax=Steinernema hermaphroditum TaxID=289476 RepID=A0AA39HKC2_9BILA|nr:hypothetical protein QR680_018453 [Steinernema hermaphroditum]